MQKKRKDIAYLLVSTLIIAGLFRTVGERFKVNGKQLAVEATKVHSVPVLAKQETTIVKEVEKPDGRKIRLTSYLESKQSPLANYTDLIIAESDEHGIDYTLLVSISGKESSYCKRMPQGSYNCWGIGGVGNFRYFSSYDESIKYVAALLGNNYRENMLKGIQVKYCPSHECDGGWVKHVAEFSRDILAIDIK